MYSRKQSANIGVLSTIAQGGEHGVPKAMHIRGDTSAYAPTPRCEHEADDAGLG